MGNISINNGGITTNKEGMPSIDLRYGPYASVSAAHAALSADGFCAVGLTVGIISGNSITEYWYQGGTSESNLVKKQSDVTIDAYTKQESDNKYQPKGNYQPAGDYATKTELNGKVDKVSGKGLSTNDYTNEDKAKVAAAITEHQDISGKADKSEVNAALALKADKSALQTLSAEVDGRLDAQDSKIELLDGHEVIVVADHTAVTSPDTQKIYREYGTDSYTDWMCTDNTTTPATWQDIATYSIPGIDDKPTQGSKNLVNSGSVFGELNEASSTEVELSSVAGKYIADSGNLGISEDYTLLYVSCSVGDKFTLKYTQDGPSTSAAKAYAIYSSSDIDDVSSSTLLVKGGKLSNVVANEDIEIVITDDTSRLICFQQYIAGIKTLVPNVTKQVVINKFDALNAKIDARGKSFSSGEEVKNVAIINDLTTGGEHNVLSAEQGKALKNNLLAYEESNNAEIEDIKDELVVSDVTEQSITLTDSVDGKYIGDSGNINGNGTATGFKVWYLSCTKGDIFKVRYAGRIPSESGARNYAVYSTDNINEASASNLLEKGIMLYRIELGVDYIIEITSDDAKLICFQQFVSGLIDVTPIVSKQTVVKTPMHEVVEDMMQIVSPSTMTLQEVPFENDGFIAESYITRSGALGTSNTYGCYKVPCAKGDKFKLFTFYDLHSSITRSYAVYSSSTNIGASTALAVGDVSSVGEVEIEITNDNAVCLLVGWRTVSDIHLLKYVSDSTINVLNEDIRNLHYDSDKVHFTYSHELKETNIREIFDLSDTIHPEYGGLTGFNSIMFQIQDKMDVLAEANPDYVTKFDAAELVNLTYPEYANGVETEGKYLVTPRYRTYGYKLAYSGSGVNGKCNRATKILITGSIHGNEQTASLNLYTIMKELCNDYLTDINLFKFRGAFELYIVPCVNGYSSIHRNRVNANGVNINRNYPTPDWAEQGESDPSSQNYRGPSAGSEFETQLIMALINKINPDMYIDAHNYDVSQPLQFYTEMTDEHNVRLAHDSLADVSFTLKKEFPQWFGTNYAMLKGDANTKYGEHAPAEHDNFTSKGPVWAFLNGTKFSLTIEISGGINYNGGVLNGHDAYIEQVYQIGEYTLMNQLMRYGEYVSNNLISPLYWEW